MSVPKSSGSDRSYRPDIDGVRAIAVLSVVFFHGGVPWVSGGFTGVDIFFVISGYLIGGHIFSAACAGNFTFLGFYQRRAKRILPAFYGMLLFSVLAALLLMSPHEARIFAITAVAASLSASNIAFWYHTNYFDTFTNLYPLLNTWSLGVEEQFYAVIPLLMVLLARIRRSLMLPAIVLACTLSFLLAWWELGRYPNNVFYLLPERAWELGAGVALAVFELTRKRITLPAALTQLVSVAGLALIAAPIFLLTAKTPFPGPAALPSVLGTALLIAVPASWINCRLLSLPSLVFIGRISYSLYLWHWPLLAYLRLTSGGPLAPVTACVALAVSFAAATLSYYLIEQPFRRSTMSPAPLLIRYAIASVLAVALCAAVWLSGGVRQRFPQLAQMDGASQLPKLDPCLITNGKMRSSPPCYDANDARPKVAIWGDSHAAALAPGMRSIAIAQGYGFVQLTHGWCAPLAGAADYMPDNLPVAAHCIGFNQQALALLAHDQRIRIVVLTACWADSFQQAHLDRWLVTDPQHPGRMPSLDAASILFRQSLEASIRTLLAAGKTILVIKDVPNFETDPMLNIRTARIPARRVLAGWMGSANTSDPGTAPAGMLNAVATADSQLQGALADLGNVAQNIQLIDLGPELCRDSQECAYRIGNQILYADAQHLDPYGAEYTLRDFHLPSAQAAQQLTGTPKATQ